MAIEDRESTQELLSLAPYPIDTRALYYDKKEQRLPVGEIIPIHFPVPADDNKSRYNCSITVIDGKPVIFARAQGPATPLNFVTSDIEVWTEEDGTLKKKQVYKDKEDSTVTTYGHNRQLAVGYVDVQNVPFFNDFKNIQTRYQLLNLQTLSLDGEIGEGTPGQKDQRGTVINDEGRSFWLFRRRTVQPDGTVESGIYFAYLKPGEVITDELEKEATQNPNNCLVKFGDNQWGGPNQLLLTRDDGGSVSALTLMHFAFEENINGKMKKIYYSGIAKISGITEEKPRMELLSGGILPTQKEINDAGFNIPVRPGLDLDQVVFASGGLFIEMEDGSYKLAVMMGVGDTQSYIKIIDLEEGISPYLSEHQVVKEKEFRHFLSVISPTASKAASESTLRRATQ